MVDPSPETVLAAEAQGLFWQMAIARKLYQTAVSERRFDDANYYIKQLRAAELSARSLLDSLANTTGGDR